MKKTDTKRIVRLALCLAFSMVLSYVEALLPIPLPFPGVKLGLANIAIVFLLYRASFGDAILVSFLRVLLSALLFGSTVSLFYSAMGALFSLLVMAGLRAAKIFSPVGVSVGGGVAHNLGQTLAACLVMESGAVAVYLPVLLVAGTAAGIVVGIAAGLLVKRVPEGK